jgi:hypothetical protein
MRPWLLVGTSSTGPSRRIERPFSCVVAVSRTAARSSLRRKTQPGLPLARYSEGPMSEGKLEPAPCQTVVPGGTNLSVDELGGIQLVEAATSGGA